MRRFTAMLMIFALAAAFSACNVTRPEETTYNYSETELAFQQTTVYSEEDTTVYEEVTAAPEITTVSAATTAAPEATTAEAITVPAVAESDTAASEKEDVTRWNTAEIVEFYKNAAAATGASVQSSRTVGLSDISVNNGQLGGVFSFVTPILSSFLSSSATVTDGITGEFERLAVSDIAAASAYETAAGIALELTLNEQTDTGAAGSPDGSVAHGIYIVGDLPSVMGQLKNKGLPIDISMENTVIKYTNPVIRAVISEDGKIVNGTWSCSVEISLSDYSFAGARVQSTRVVLENNITVNGGFSA